MYYRSDKQSKLFRLLDMLSGIIKLRKRIDIILLDTYSTKAFYYAWLCSILCRIVKLPYICVLRGGDLPKRIQITPKLSDQLFKKAKSNVALSGYLKQVFDDCKYPVNVIPNFILIKNYPLNHSVRNKHRLIWVRSFHRMYNPEMAIRLVKPLKLDFYDIDLVMVGPDKDGSLEKCIKLAESLGVKNRITFTGKLSNDEWIDLGKECGIFINTTTVDNFPISVLEAMALSIPVVTTNVGGIPWIVEDLVEGFLVDPNNTEMMVQSVYEILSDHELYDQMSKAARLKAEKFDWNNIAPLWTKTIEDSLI